MKRIIFNEELSEEKIEEICKYLDTLIQDEFSKKQTKNHGKLFEFYMSKRSMFIGEFKILSSDFVYGNNNEEQVRKITVHAMQTLYKLMEENHAQLKTKSTGGLAKIYTVYKP